MGFQLFGLRRLVQADQVAVARVEVLEPTVSVVQAEVAARWRGPVSQPPHYPLR